MEPIERLEAAFSMPFEDIIQRIHIAEKRSILWIAKRAGISRPVIYAAAKKRGITLLSMSDAAKNRSAHHRHPLAGKTLLVSSWARANSLRMRLNNPSRDPEIRERMSIALADNFRKYPLPQESAFIELLRRHGVIAEFQVPFGPYVLDFMVDGLCIEIDSTDKWGKERRKNAEKKDAYLRDKNVSVLRINKRWLSDEKIIIDLLKRYNVI